VKALESLRMLGALLAGRTRALLLRIRGMRVGAKVSFGPAVRVRRPWCISLGTRCEIEQNVFLKVVDDAARVEIGDFVFIGNGCELDAAVSIVIGPHTLLAPRVFITDHTHNAARGVRLAAQGTRSAGVTIGSDVWLGTGSIVLHGVTIGDGAIVGAGAVVNRDVAPNTIVAGVPARVVGERTEAR
jgi:acetyltransferase-like isoleucine patch superfamily enzyme